MSQEDIEFSPNASLPWTLSLIILARESSAVAKKGSKGGLIFQVPISSTAVKEKGSAINYRERLKVHS